MRKVNDDIREAAKKSRVPLWKVAKSLEVADTTLSRWMRQELSPELKTEVFNIIRKLGSETV